MDESKCKQLDLISRYASRHQRDYRNALKDLQSLQDQRQQRERQELSDAALLRKFYQMEEKPFSPAEFGYAANGLVRRDLISSARCEGRLG